MTVFLPSGSRTLSREDVVTRTSSKIAPSALLHVSCEKDSSPLQTGAFALAALQLYPIPATLAARQCNHLRCANFSLHTPNPPARRPLTSSQQQQHQLSADTHPALFFPFHTVLQKISEYETGGEGKAQQLGFGAIAKLPRAGMWENFRCEPGVFGHKSAGFFSSSPLVPVSSFLRFPLVMDWSDAAAEQGARGSFVFYPRGSFAVEFKTRTKTAQNGRDAQLTSSATATRGPRKVRCTTKGYSRVPRTTLWLTAQRCPWHSRGTLGKPPCYHVEICTSAH